MRDELSNDEALVAAGNHGDEKALDALYQKYREWVLAMAYRITGQHADAADVTQEVFIYLFGKFPFLSLRANLKTLLYPVVRNTALNVIRKRRKIVPLNTASELLPQTAFVFPNDENGLPKTANSLSAEAREVLHLRFVDDLSIDEISRCLQIPVGTVKSRLFNALQNLKKVL